MRLIACLVYKAAVARQAADFWLYFHRVIVPTTPLQAWKN